MFSHFSMLSSKKPSNQSKFNSMAQIQIKCVKLTKTTSNSKSNRSNSSLNLTSPPQSKEKPEDSMSIKQKLHTINTHNAITLSSAPKNYFLMPAHNSNSTLNRSKTLHHYKMNLANSHNDQLNDSNKENYNGKCASPMQNSMGFFSKTAREETPIVKNSMKGKKINEDSSALSHRFKNNNWQMNGIRENDEDVLNESKKGIDKITNDFFCLRHPTKKVLIIFDLFNK